MLSSIKARQHKHAPLMHPYVSTSYLFLDINQCWASRGGLVQKNVDWGWKALGQARL